MDPASVAYALRIVSIVLGVITAFSVAGAYYFERQVARQKDERIAELQRRTSIISSLELRVTMEVPSPGQPSPVIQEHDGLQSIADLWSGEQVRFRLVSNYRFSEQQITDGVRRISFVYVPETPREILGRQIEFLNSMNRCVLDNTNVFREFKFDVRDGPTKFDVAVLVNGVEVVSHVARLETASLLSSGQASMDVSEAFAGFSEKYARRVREKAISAGR